jgi:hypothetical protein
VIAAHLDQGIGDGVPQMVDRRARALLVVDVPLQDRRAPAGRRLAGVDRNQDGGFAEQGRDSFLGPPSTASGIGGAVV